MATQSGYFLFADITGYTQYLSESELDHAQQTLAALLNLLIKQTKPPLVISRLAGDAVISYGPRDSFVHGQTFVEMLEQTYVEFRRRIELMVRNTTCPCNACRNIGGLDLKFFVHFGEYAVQKLDAHDELVGSDVNLLHRLLKNSVTAETGIRAYTLYTDAALRQLGLAGEMDGLVAHDEAYEHLGTVQCWVQDMHPVWEARRSAAQMRVAPENEAYRMEIDIAAAPEAIWDYIVQPQHLNVLLGGDRMHVDNRKGSRVAVGSIYQCYHGDSVISNLVVGWEPFERIVVQFGVPVPIQEATVLAEIWLAPDGDGTHMVEIIGKCTGPLLGRMAGDAGLKAREPHMRGLQRNFKALVEGDLSMRRQVLPASAVLSEAEVGVAAREAATNQRVG